VTINRINWISFVLVGVMFGVAAWVYPMLPDPMPSHWNAAGEVDDWMSKPWGALVMPLVALGSWVMFLVLPLISPKGFRLDAARRAYDIIWFVMILFLGAVQGVVYLEALGRGGPGVEQIVPLMTGGLFILIGNYLTKFPKNFFVGIRTPWTLASDEVWNRTHRLGSWMFIGAGVLIAASAFLPGAMNVLIVAVIVAAFVPVLYSLWLYRRLHGFDSGEESSGS
jgi:uncharacterized membrane protein